MAVQPTLQGGVSAAERLYAQAAAPESSKRSGTAENDRCRCTVWPSSSRKMGYIFVSLSFMRTEAFFTLPGRFACPAFGHSRPASAIAGVKERKEVKEMNTLVIVLIAAVLSLIHI